ncbi:MAG: hypothetical protein MJ048_01050 [Acidaminococcaceae bacterium]|nr:hypothetical protein [Acidaminococcaceae bacterium]MDO4935372.1 hypothetical protein [Phascolarctobacterium sp.]
MDFFDDVLGRIIPLIIVFVIFRNLLTVIFGGRRGNDSETEEEPVEYDETGNPVETEPIEDEGEDPVEAEKRKILEEFERVMKLPKEPLPYDPELSKPQHPAKKEQKVIRDSDLTIHRENETLTHDTKGIIHRDGETLEHDKSKIYTEKPLIEEEQIEHIEVTEKHPVQRKCPARPQLVNAVKWMEILGKPKGF